MATKQVLSERSSAVPGWELEDDKLYRKFEFSSFPKAIAFMCEVAFICERMNHHPEWLNVHTTVKIWLTSHDVGRVSERDIALARLINEQ